ncbi:hypothetical protein KFU94_52790 [Chloroflexi bacterium TSY]|nr:hypothetical protein [Chloroflexi bacterium TSY]
MRIQHPPWPVTDLRFTPAEAAEFLNQVMGLTLSAKEIADLETRTEGWIAGLQMAARSTFAPSPLQPIRLTSTTKYNL